MDDDVVPEAKTLLSPINTNTNTATASVAEEKCKVEPTEDEEKKGGLLDQIISLVSPRAGASNQAQVFGDTQQVESGTEETGESAGEGGSNLIHNLVSHLYPYSFPDDAATTNDEASILLHPVNNNTNSPSVAEETAEKSNVEPKEGEEEKKKGLLDQIISLVSPGAGASQRAQGFGESLSRSQMEQGRLLLKEVEVQP